MRQQHPSSASEPDVFEGTVHFPVEPGSVRLRIEGLVQVGPEVFDLRGVKVREISWEALARALGRDHLPDALAAKIDNACFQYDVAEILSERIERR